VTRERDDIAQPELVGQVDELFAIARLTIACDCELDPT
jgi:hypothetical protein